MKEGIVKRFDHQRGFGFIEVVGARDIFVHYSDIDGKGFRTLQEGQKVSFVPVETAKGPKATQVKILE